MQLANQYAQRYGHEFITDVDLLMAVARWPSGVAANVLVELNVDLGDLCSELDELARSDGYSPSGAKPSILYALEERSDLNHNYVDTEHLLLGIARDKQSACTQLLERYGVTYQVLRTKIENL